MQLADKFNSIACRQDTQARRVLNVAPDTEANISSEELEAGVTLERLAALNVPVFRYATQVTIHGRLPDFNPEARPGGYKSLFLNQNGSAGVRYAAIDAAKKDLLFRAVRVAKDGAWHASLNSQGLDIYRTFIVGDEDGRAQAKEDALNALRSIPVQRFFGAAFAFTLPYGGGYGAGASIGAVPQEELQPLLEFFSGFKSEADVIAAEQARQAERDAYFANLRAQNEAAAEQRRRDNEAKWAALQTQLERLASAPTDGVVYVVTDGIGGEAILEVKVETSRGRLYTTTLSRNFSPNCVTKRHLAKNGFPWPKALAAGRVYRQKEAARAA